MAKKKKTKNANPKQIVRDLRDNRKQQKTQREAMVEQITIADAKIDQFDEMIAPVNAAQPPTPWTMEEPAKSKNPASLKYPPPQDHEPWIG